MPRSRRLTFELLETFVRVIDNGGRASLTARQLGVNQASMSKRLAQPGQRRPADPPAVAGPHRQALAADPRGPRLAARRPGLVRRYDQLREALEDAGAGAPAVAFACGQQTVSGFVCEAVARCASVSRRSACASPRCAAGPGCAGGRRGARPRPAQPRPGGDRSGGGPAALRRALFEDPLVLVAAARPAANGRGGSPRCRTSDSALGRRRTSR